MTVATALISNDDPAVALAEAARAARAALGRTPDFALAIAIGHGGTDAPALANPWPTEAAWAVGFGRSAATAEDSIAPGGRGVALFAIADSLGSFGTARSSDTATRPIPGVLASALAQAGRAGELPALIWTQPQTGGAGTVLAELEAQTGGHAPIFGAELATLAPGAELALAVCFPSVAVGCAVAAQGVEESCRRAIRLQGAEAHNARGALVYTGAADGGDLELAAAALRARMPRCAFLIVEAGAAIGREPGGSNRVSAVASSAAVFLEEAARWA